MERGEPIFLMNSPGVVHRGIIGCDDLGGCGWPGSNFRPHPSGWSSLVSRRGTAGGTGRPLLASPHYPGGGLPGEQGGPFVPRVGHLLPSASTPASGRSISLGAARGFRNHRPSPNSLPGAARAPKGAQRPRESNGLWCPKGGVGSLSCWLGARPCGVAQLDVALRGRPGDASRGRWLPGLGVPAPGGGPCDAREAPPLVERARPSPLPFGFRGMPGGAAHSGLGGASAPGICPRTSGHGGKIRPVRFRHCGAARFSPSLGRLGGSALRVGPLLVPPLARAEPSGSAGNPSAK